MAKIEVKQFTRVTATEIMWTPANGEYDSDKGIYRTTTPVGTGKVECNVVKNDTTKSFRLEFPTVPDEKLMHPKDLAEFFATVAEECKGYQMGYDQAKPRH